MFNRGHASKQSKDERSRSLLDHSIVNQQYSFDEDNRFHKKGFSSLDYYQDA